MQLLLFFFLSKNSKIEFLFNDFLGHARTAGKIQRKYIESVFEVGF